VIFENVTLRYANSKVFAKSNGYWIDKIGNGCLIDLYKREVSDSQNSTVAWQSLKKLPIYWVSCTWVSVLLMSEHCYSG